MDDEVEDGEFRQCFALAGGESNSQESRTIRISLGIEKSPSRSLNFMERIVHGDDKLMAQGFQFGSTLDRPIANIPNQRKDQEGIGALNLLVQLKLDHFLVCQSFLNLWRAASLVSLMRERSDHRPILLTTTPMDFGPISFKVYNSWLEFPGLMKRIQNLCKRFKFYGPADMALATKLKKL
ncbi:hypothetical protein E3N88_29576 [Mikania micrantha]|uniref:Uncharacterized protein n=1 Tax=Mikania micrantha TaxID=192012 RepID=A0A5N6MJL3_9ASTR|nr:hypothetical protein E3N88_29576 [Mikania micrantha]